MTSRPIRLLRGSVAAVFSTFVAAFSHVSGGGQPPTLLLLAAGILFATIFCTALTGRSLSWWRTAVSVCFTQLLLHLVFSISPSATSQPVTGGGHLGHGDLSALTPLMAGSKHHDVTSPAMLVWHLFAAAITVVALRYGEGACWRILTTVLVAAARSLFPTRRPLPVTLGTSVCAGGGYTDPLLQRFAAVKITHPLRGPPAFV